MEAHWLLFLGLLTSKGSGTQDYQSLREGRGLCEMWKSDISVLRETAKSKGPGNKPWHYCHPPSINQKVTLSSPLSFSHIYSKNALFFFLLVSIMLI